MANPPSTQNATTQASANPLAAVYLNNPDVAVNDAIAQMGGNPLVRNPFTEYARKFLGAVLPTLFNTVTAGGSTPGNPYGSGQAMDLIPQQLALAEQFFQGGNQTPYASLAGIAQDRMKQLQGLPSTVLAGMAPGDLQNMYGQLQDLGNLGANPALRSAYDFLYGQAVSNYAGASAHNPNLPDFLNWIMQTNPYGIAQNFQTGQGYTPPPYTPPAYTPAYAGATAAGANQAGGAAVPPAAAYGNSSLATLK